MGNQCFLKYFDNWKISIANSLQITCLSLIEVAKYLLTTGGCKCFLSERLNEDKTAENYFGIQRSIGGHEENPTVFDFGYNDNAICNGVCTKSIMRNVARNHRYNTGSLSKKKVFFTRHQRIIIRFLRMMKKEGRRVNHCSLLLNKWLFL